MFEIGRMCVKIAGRDAKSVGVVVDMLDARYVLVDGQMRRKKCNCAHLEPLPKVLSITKGASHEDVTAALKAVGVICPQKVEKLPKTETEHVNPKK